jgi:hypothetical protein
VDGYAATLAAPQAVYFRSMIASWRGRPPSIKVEPIGRDRRDLLIGPYTVNNAGQYVAEPPPDERNNQISEQFPLMLLVEACQRFFQQPAGARLPGG